MLRLQARPRLELHERDGFPLRGVERHEEKAGLACRRPRRARGVDAHERPILRVHLPQLDEQGAAVAAVGAVPGAGRVPHVGPRGVVPVLVGEHAFEHQELLSQPVGVFREAASRGVADNARGPRHFLAVPLQHAPLDPGQRRVEPGHSLGLDDHPSRDVRVQEHVDTGPRDTQAAVPWWMPLVDPPRRVILTIVPRYNPSTGRRIGATKQEESNGQSQGVHIRPQR